MGLYLIRCSSHFTRVLIHHYRQLILNVSSANRCSRCVIHFHVRSPFYLLMERTIQVAEEEGKNIFDLPLEETDGSLLFSTLIKYFPKAKGLKYYREVHSTEGIRLCRGRFYPPYSVWGSMVYYCEFSRGNYVSLLDMFHACFKIYLYVSIYESSVVHRSNNLISFVQVLKMKIRCLRIPLASNTPQVMKRKLNTKLMRMRLILQKR